MLFLGNILPYKYWAFLGSVTLGVDTMCSPPALKPEKPSPRVHNGNICCLKS